MGGQNLIETIYLDGRKDHGDGFSVTGFSIYLESSNNNYTLSIYVFLGIMI